MMRQLATRHTDGAQPREGRSPSSRAIDPKGRGRAKSPKWSVRDLTVGYVFGVVTVVAVLAAVWGINRLPVHRVTPTLIANFAAMSNGAVPKATSGQTWSNSSNGAAGSELSVVDGRLTNNAVTDGAAAGILSADLPSAVTMITAKFGFVGAGSTGNGAAVILVSADPAPKSENLMAHLTSPCYLIVSPTQVAFGVVNDGRLSFLDTSKFDAPLSDNTEHEVQMEVNYETGIAKIKGPDGRVRVHSDPRITANRGSIANFEVYQKNAATDDRAYFTYVEAG